MKIIILTIVFLFGISCTSKYELTSEFLQIDKYEIAYNSITNKLNKEQPFLNEYKSDASGVKIIPKIFKITNYSIYGTEYFENEKSFTNNDIIKFSKKYTKANWRKDKNFRTLMISELKKFHGPLKYIYFSEIKNDSLRAEILGNPFAEYSMTPGDHYLIIFENNKIKSIQKSHSDYD